MQNGRFVAYYRVSTARQGASGLGLEAQRNSVMQFLNGGKWKMVAEFVEVESGRKADRAELRKALSACRIHAATLVVAKFDRLSRNAAFLLALRDSSVECLAVDMPDANRLTVGIMAMVAEHEAEAISTRTKEALKAAKARGVKLGNPGNLKPEARRKGTAASAKRRSAISASLNAEVAEQYVQTLRDEGLSLRAVAQNLNDRGVPARRGGPWTATQVWRVAQAT